MKNGDWRIGYEEILVRQIKGIPDMVDCRNPVLTQENGDDVKAGVRLVEPVLRQPGEGRLGDLALLEGGDGSLRRTA